MWTGVTPGDGPGGVPPDPARQRPHGRADGYGRTPGACAASGARRVSTCVRSTSGPAARRTDRSIRARSGRSSRRSLQGIARHPVDAQVASLPFASSLCGACFEVCPGPDRHPRGPRPPARPGRPRIRGHPPPPDARSHRDARDGLDDDDRRAGSGAAERLAGLAGRVFGRRGRLSRIPGPGPIGGWFRSRDLPAPARESFRAWWRRTDGGRGRRPMTTRADATASTRPEDVVLARIRAALADAPGAGRDPARLRRGARPRDGHRGAVRRARPATTGRPSVAPRQAELATTIAAILAGRPAHRLVVPSGVPADWFERRRGSRSSGTIRRLSHAELDGLDGVVTGCAVAIAETGTIVLDAGPDQGRRAHQPAAGPARVCRPDRPDRRERARRRSSACRRPARSTWISGPSATSDIELQRVEGVHGPRRLDVVVVDA